MPLRAARWVLAIAAAIAVGATGAAAQDLDCNRKPPNVRGASDETAALLRDVVERSATAHDLVEQLERLNATIYIRYEWFTSATLRGRIGFLTASTADRRMLVIELAARYTRIEQMSALGHELQHALEIAGAPDVYDSRTLATFYRKIGEPMGRLAGSETYETTAAAETGRRVRTELIAGPAHADVAVDTDRN
jgi:hypothetical protein